MKNTLTFKYFEQKRQAYTLERLDKKVDSCMPNRYPVCSAESSKSKFVIRVPEYSKLP